MNQKFEYFLVLLLIYFSGSPLLEVIGKDNAFIILLMVIWIYFIKNKVGLTIRDFNIILLFVLIIILHLIFYQFVVIYPSLGFMVMIMSALFYVRSIRDFYEKYINIIYYSSILSLIVWGINILGVDMVDILSIFHVQLSSSDVYNVIFHNFHLSIESLERNSGFFWEPGAFSGYIILALIFVVMDRSFLIKNKVKILILILTLITTQSTTGLIGLILFIYLYLLSDINDYLKIKRKLKITLLIVTSLVTFFLYSNLTFFGQKIDSQYESTITGQDSAEINRMGNFLYDLDWISKSPLFGWSSSHNTRALVDPEVLDLVQGQGNGFTGFTVKYGILGMLFFLYLCATTFMSLSNSIKISFFATLILIVTLNGEQFLNYPLFFTIMFLPSLKNYKEYK